MTMALLTACTDGTVYCAYDHTPLSGWEKSDFLTFNVGRIKANGNYNIDLGLRTSGNYPFMNLTLIVDQHLFPDERILTDTVHCQLTDAQGESTGNGVNLFQYTFHVKELRLNEGDSIVINVRHDMKREILPGISDIGIEVVNKP